MKFKNLKPSASYGKTNGSHLVGNIRTTYKRLIETFGLPHGSDGYKTDAEWSIEFEDGTIATIYNWKDGKNYLGADGASLNEIEEWHIGGFNHDAVERVFDSVQAGSLTVA